MQSVSDAWSVEEVDSVRRIAQNLRISWKKDSLLANRTFTIGTSLIGGNDVLGADVGAIGSPANYRYFDESAYALSLGYESGYSIPLGGLTMGMAEAKLDNTSGRFTPRYMGGNSELFTAILPRRPIIISGGFNFGGIDNTIPQFTGILNKTPEVDKRNGEVKLSATDYIDYFNNRYLDHSVMFTAQRSDIVIETLLTQLGMSTSQYDLDPGLNIIKFGIFDTGMKFGNVINQIAMAENAHFYQDELGIFKFENRQHWDSSPYTDVQRVITTGQVLNAEAPSEDHIINAVEVKGSPREVVNIPEIVWSNNGYAGGGVILLPAGKDTDVWANYNDPIFSVDTPVPNGSGGQTSFFAANTLSDGSGTDMTDSVYLKNMDNFAQASKMIFHNNSTQDVYLVVIALTGRPARRTGDIYYRSEYGHSITAYEERPLVIENDYIQDLDWARTYATMILEDFSQPENLQKITIRAIPELQKGDLVSWQGRYWRVFDVKTTINPSVGYIQELTMLQRTIKTYFRIGISLIGGSDRIST